MRSSERSITGIDPRRLRELLCSGCDIRRIRSEKLSLNAAEVTGLSPWLAEDALMVGGGEPPSSGVSSSLMPIRIAGKLQRYVHVARGTQYMWEIMCNMRV